MNNRAVVNVATGHYLKGQDRLLEKLAELGEDYRHWRHCLPLYSPKHQDVPYAFKAWALKATNELHGAEVLLWCDASVYPIRRLDRLWDKIERDGYWIARNGWNNYEWTADSAYPDLFPECFTVPQPTGENNAKASNLCIPHVVATAFGLDLRHPTGKAIFDEYLRLAQTRAFCGPWINANHKDANMGDVSLSRCAPCGPPDVRGHRHDQTALSVIAWRLGCVLSDCPDYFAYADEKEPDERTILLAKGI